MSQDILTRLRAYRSPQWGSALKDIHDAADEIERLRARVESLRGALKSAAGWLEDANAPAAADMCRGLAGDMEP